MEIFRTVAAVFFALASGGAIATAVMAVIAALGAAPRLAQKTSTERYLKTYETAIALGGVLGAVTHLFSFSLDLPLIPGNILMVLIGLAIGVFYGCMAMSLAEVLDVLPILTRRSRIKYGLRVIIISLACGKLVGALVYFLKFNGMT